MIGYKIAVDKTQVDGVTDLLKFVGGNVDRAYVVAINKTLPSVRRAANEEIQKDVRLTFKYINGKLEIQKANKNKISGRVIAETRGLLMAKYATRLNQSATVAPKAPKTGIKVKIKPAGPVKTLSKDYFYMILPNSGALAIAKRRPLDSPGKNGGLIDVAYSPSVSQVFNQVRDRILPAAVERYEKELIDAVRYLIQKKYPVE